MRPVARRQLLVAAVLVAALVLGLVLSRLRSGADQAASPKAVSAATASPAPPASAGAETVAEARRDRTAEGARATALAYAAGVQQEVVYLPDPEARKVLAGWMAPGVDPAEVDRTATELESTRKALLATSGQAWWVVSPLAAKAGPFTPDRAQVAVWLVRILASSGATGGYVPTSGWLTATVELVWADGPGWSIWSVSSAPGPVPGPTVTDRPATSAEFTSALNGFSLVKEHH